MQGAGSGQRVTNGTTLTLRSSTVTARQRGPQPSGSLSMESGPKWPFPLWSQVLALSRTHRKPNPATQSQQGPRRSSGPTFCDILARGCPPCLIPSSGGELITSLDSSVLSQHRSHGATRLSATLRCAPSFIPFILPHAWPSSVRSGPSPLLCGEQPVPNTERVHTAPHARTPEACRQLWALSWGTALQRPQPAGQLLPRPCRLSGAPFPRAPLPAWAALKVTTATALRCSRNLRHPPC